MSEISKHKVAVVVFMEVDGIDQGDASNVAEMMVSEMIRESGHKRTLVHNRINPQDGTPFTLTWDGTVVNAMEVGRAAGNGYLWQQPTVKAFREWGEHGRYER